MSTTTRGPKSAEAYKKIGGGSPINMYTRQQAHLIEESLHSKGYDAKCYIGMRYWHPFTEEVRIEIVTWDSFPNNAWCNLGAFRTKEGQYFFVGYTPSLSSCMSLKWNYSVVFFADYWFSFIFVF